MSLIDEMNNVASQRLPSSFKHFLLTEEPHDSPQKMLGRYPLRSNGFPGLFLASMLTSL